jgi:hypothetical protein
MSLHPTPKLPKRKFQVHKALYFAGGLVVILVIVAIVWQAYKATPKLAKLQPSPTPLQTYGVDQAYGFAIYAPKLVRSEAAVFGHPIILYCDSAITEATNICPQYGISISVYETPEFGGACYDFERNVDMTKPFVIAGRNVSYCDDIKNRTIRQVYIDRSTEGKKSYSLLATYDDVYTKATALRDLATFTLTNP